MGSWYPHLACVVLHYSSKHSRAEERVARIVRPTASSGYHCGKGALSASTSPVVVGDRGGDPRSSLLPSKIAGVESTGATVLGVVLVVTSGVSVAVVSTELVASLSTVPATEVSAVLWFRVRKLRGSAVSAVSASMPSMSVTSFAVLDTLSPSLPTTSAAAALCVLSTVPSAEVSMYSMSASPCAVSASPCAVKSRSADGAVEALVPVAAGDRCELGPPVELRRLRLPLFLLAFSSASLPFAQVATLNRHTQSEPETNSMDRSSRAAAAARATSQLAQWIGGQQHSSQRTFLRTGASVPPPSCSCLKAHKCHIKITRQYMGAARYLLQYSVDLCDTHTRTPTHRERGRERERERVCIYYDYICMSCYCVMFAIAMCIYDEQKVKPGNIDSDVRCFICHSHDFRSTSLGHYFFAHTKTSHSITDAPAHRTHDHSEKLRVARPRVAETVANIRGSRV